jgi:hypothetical protein
MYDGQQRSAAQLLLQRAAAAEFQDDVRQAGLLADLVDLHDIGVLQAGDGLRLGAEARQLGLPGVCPRQDHLQRHQSIQLPVPRLVHHAHASPAQFAKDLVARHGVASRESCGRRRRRQRRAFGRRRRRGNSSGGR